MHINFALPLVDAADALPLADAALPLASAALPLAGVIFINANDIHRAIRFDPVLKIHYIDGKHNAEGIYHNKITPPVRSSIHCYQVRKKGGVVPAPDENLISFLLAKDLRRFLLIMITCSFFTLLYVGGKYRCCCSGRRRGCCHVRYF